MKISVGDLHTQSAALLAAIEKGEVCVLTRDNEAVAEVIPLHRNGKGWKRNIRRVSLPEGVTTAHYLEAERDSA